MNVHKIIFSSTPQPIQEFFDTIERIEEKIAKGQDFSDEVKNITDDSTKITRSLQGKYGIK